MLNEHFGKHRKETNLILFFTFMKLKFIRTKYKEMYSSTNNPRLSSCREESSFSTEISTESGAYLNITGTRLCKDQLFSCRLSSSLKNIWPEEIPSDPSAENVTRWMQCYIFKHKGN
jgi:hypothetical protein